MTEHRLFAYEIANLPVRLLLAHFVAFSQDKLARPEFFCWPGAWMAGERAAPEVCSTAIPVFRVWRTRLMG